MNRDECRVGMLVDIGDESVKAIVIKANPRRAKVRIAESQKRGRFVVGSIWNVPYNRLVPILRDSSDHTMIVMKSFEEPENDAIKTYMKQAEKADLPIGELERQDELILEAICEIYNKIDDFKGKKRYELSSKINLLFAALGREVSKEASEEWMKAKKGICNV